MVYRITIKWKIVNEFYDDFDNSITGVGVNLKLFCSDNKYIAQFPDRVVQNYDRDGVPIICSEQALKPQLPQNIANIHCIHIF